MPGQRRSSAAPQQAPTFLSSLFDLASGAVDHAQSNDLLQSLMQGGDTSPAAPATLKPPSATNSLMTPAASFTPKQNGGFLQEKKGLLTVGNAFGVGDTANPSANFLTAQGGGGRGSAQIGHTAVDGGTQKTVTTGAAWDASDLSKTALVFGNANSTPGIDPTTGKTTSSGDASAVQISKEGAAWSNRQTTNGASTDRSFGWTMDGMNASFGQTDANGGGYAFGGGISADRIDVNATGKLSKEASIGGGAYVTNKTEGGSSTSGLMGGFEVAHTTGGGVSVNASYDNGAAGVSGKAAASTMDRVGYQRSPALVEAEFDSSILAGMPFASANNWAAIQENKGALDAYMKLKYGDRLDGVHSVADAGLTGMKTGEGFTFDHQNSTEIEASGRAGGLSVGFGDKDKNVNRTSIARSEKGWTIRVDTADSDADIAKLNAVKAVGLDMESVETDAQSIELNVADDETGRKALEQFSATGLLPGAEKLADPFDGDVMILDVLGPAIQTMSADPNADPMMLEALRRQAFEASGRLNSRVLGANGRQALDLQSESIQYTGHTTSHTEASKAELSLLGFKLMDAGVTEKWWEDDYREEGKTETEFAYKRDERHFIAPNESTQVAVNPKGTMDRKNPVELALMSTQTTTAGQREIVDRVGAGGMDPAMRHAWAQGQVHEGEKAQMAMVLSQGQLDTIETKLGPKGDDFANLQADATNALEDFSNLQGMVLGVESLKQRNAMGEDGSKALIAKVSSKEAFNDKLSPEERRQFLIFAAQGAQHRDEWGSKKAKGSQREDANPWRALPLALGVEDKEERNQLVRTMFDAIEESSTDSTTALLQLVDFLDQDGAAAGMSVEERRELTAGLAVRVKDGRVEDRAKLLAKDPATAAQSVAAGLLSDQSLDMNMSDMLGARGVSGGPQAILEAHRANAMVDWLMAAERAGGSQLVTSSVFAAMAFDPGVVQRILENARHEPWRLEVATNLLARAGALPKT